MTLHPASDHRYWPGAV